MRFFQSWREARKDAADPIAFSGEVGTVRVTETRQK